MAGDTHYEVLGVAHDTPAPEMRKAYLRMARRYHPDFHASADEQTRLAAELMMRDINAAWEVLGNYRTRERYDRKLREADAAAATAAAAAAVVPSRSKKMKKKQKQKIKLAEKNELAEKQKQAPPRPGEHARPEPRPEAASGARLPGWLTLAPPGLIALAFSSFIVGMVVQLAALFIAGLVLAIAGATMFILVPAVALKRAKER